MLTCLVPVLFTFYIQGVLKVKKNNSGAKVLMCYIVIVLQVIFTVASDDEITAN
jgi:hypothetical protein